MSAARHDVPPESYATVIREMIRHENDVTNHRIMWLLIGQGFVANAFVSLKNEGTIIGFTFCIGGILLSLSAFLMLYKSYQARGYLQVLGQRAKQGALREEQLPLIGWPRRHVRDWSREVWANRWLGHLSDLLEPWFFLPWLFLLTWTGGLLRIWVGLPTALCLAVGTLGSVLTIVLCCLLTVRAQAGERVREASIRAA
jgi:hypothetical protein